MFKVLCSVLVLSYSQGVGLVTNRVYAATERVNRRRVLEWEQIVVYTEPHSLSLVLRVYVNCAVKLIFSFIRQYLQLLGLFNR